ncbi:FAD-dependent oxidoreductase [Floridanema evergladense]|uniref:FAD-dependent oxidoreductase n=1 Tax=Floridaenema evergladense BLCC-F167 TaxID=3153639 RepID=A0ABV4WQP2_9CYAN
MTQLLIVGGSDAGISAALRAKELDSTVTPIIVMADDFPNFSICGLPFFLSGEVADWRNLAHRTKEDITLAGIQLLTNHTATAIRPQEKVVIAVDIEGNEKLLTYDRLLVGTGALSNRPHIAGIDLPGVYFLRWMADSFAVEKHIAQFHPKSAVIVGGGYIGLEMADALVLRGLNVTLVEHNPSVLKTVDPSLGEMVRAELQRHQVTVATGVSLETIQQQGNQLKVFGSNGFEAIADLVLVAVGAKPNTHLAQTAGIELGMTGAIRVNRKMETNLPDIYAAGDCVETWHRVLNQNSYLPLGTTAHKQGRVAGANAVGGNQEFAGSLGTQVVKIFDLAVARTGLRDREALAAGFDPLTVESEVWDHKVYYPGAHQLRIRVTGDRQTGKLLGAQIAGHYQGEVAKRVDIYATALFHGMTVEAINEIDLSYTPPLGSPWDAVQMSAQAWSKASHNVISVPESVRS